jgi:isohexenylglutaconyl-CoA hydratase
MHVVDVVHVVTKAGIVFVTLNDPAHRNALGAPILDALERQLARAEEDAAIRAFVLRGAGGVFCSGGDFGAFKSMLAASMSEGAPDPIAQNNRTFGRLLTRLVDLPVPTIAVVAGAAAGGGTGLAAACDIVLAHTSATFATPEVTLGFPPAQIAPFVAARIGRARAVQLLCEGRRLDARMAVDVGLADRVVDDTGPALLDQLHRLDRSEPAAVRATKRILAFAGTRDAQLDFAAHRFADGLRGNADEGLAAFIAKRPPKWARSLDTLPEMPQ